MCVFAGRKSTSAQINEFSTGAQDFCTDLHIPNTFKLRGRIEFKGYCYKQLKNFLKDVLSGVQCGKGYHL